MISFSQCGNQRGAGPLRNAHPGSAPQRRTKYVNDHEGDFSCFRGAAATALCLMSFFGVGCSSLNLQKPTASVTGMDVQNVTTNGYTMNFAVDVANPNSFELPLSAADYSLGVGGVKALDGKADPGGSVPAKGSRKVTLPVNVTFQNLMAAEKAVQASGGNPSYDFDGGLSFGSQVPLMSGVRVPIHYSGTLPLRDILSNPSAPLGSDAAKKLMSDFGGLRVP